MSFRLQTLKKRSDFLRARNGRYHAAPGVVLQASKVPASRVSNGQNEVSLEGCSGDLDGAKSVARFGFTATKKLGNAVIRNRIKRRLREAVRKIAPQLARNGYEYVLIGRKSTLKRPYSSLLHDLTIAFDKVHGKRGTGRSGKNRKNPKRQTSGR